jgi:hypothetical protein
MSAESVPMAVQGENVDTLSDSVGGHQAAPRPVLLTFKTAGQPAAMAPMRGPTFNSHG